MSIAIVSRVEMLFTGPPLPPDEPTGRPEGVVLDKYTLLRLETQLKKELIALMTTSRQPSWRCTRNTRMKIPVWKGRSSVASSSPRGHGS